MVIIDSLVNLIIVVYYNYKILFSQCKLLLNLFKLGYMNICEKGKF